MGSEGPLGGAHQLWGATWALEVVHQPLVGWTNQPLRAHAKRIKEKAKGAKLGRSPNRIPPPLWEVDSSLVAWAEALLGGGAKAASSPLTPIYIEGF